MGYYINNVKGKFLPTKGKAKFLTDNIEGSENLRSKPPENYSDNIVCVIENLMFDAALYCYSENEFNYVKSINDGRQKTWLIIPDAKNYID
jgi:hypothetical protein